MKYIDYQIVGGTDEEEVVKEIKDLLAQGWELVGGVCAIQHRNGTVCTGQALALPEPKKGGRK